MNDRHIEKTLRKAVANIVKQPSATLCKHFVALQVPSAIDSIGYEVPEELATALFEADDATALAILDCPLQERVK